MLLSHLLFALVVATQQLNSVLSDFQAANNVFLYDAKLDAPVIDYQGTDDIDPVFPDFIYKSNSARVIEFYSPWCPTCQKFADTYVAFAKRLESLTAEMGIDPVKVYSVSCEAHSEVCQNFNVHTYPQVHLLRAGATNTTSKIRSNRVHPFNVLNRLGITAEPLPLDHLEPLPPVSSSSRRRMGDKVIVPRTKQNIFDDAFRSFDYTLRHGVFTSEGSLRERPRDGLRQLLELLQLIILPGWKLRGVVNALLENFGQVVENKSAFVAIIDEFSHPPESWSLSCTKGVSGMGYTCGLWELFHIVTIGIVEWNTLVDQDEPQLLVSTVHGAAVLRNFVELFFGCEDCRAHFLRDYDTCAFGLCSRLSDEHHKLSEWLQLPVWLFEVHNAVTVRTVREAAEADGSLGKDDDGKASLWPPSNQCPKCWKDDGSWDDVSVYKYLRAEYWLEDSKAVKYRQEVGVSEPDSAEEAEDFPGVVWKVAFVGGVVILILLIRRRSYVQKGLHKRG